MASHAQIREEEEVRETNKTNYNQSPRTSLTSACQVIPKLCRQPRRIEMQLSARSIQKHKQIFNAHVQLSFAHSSQVVKSHMID